MKNFTAMQMNMDMMNLMCGMDMCGMTFDVEKSTDELDSYMDA